MARVFAKTLISTAAALLTVSFAPAQSDSFAEGVKQYRLGNLDAAKQKFEEVLASDPTNAQAFELYQNTDAAVWRALLLEQGEINKIAKYLLNMATIGRKERSRDQDAINAAVDQAVSADYGARSQAILHIASEFGEFAVPALVAKLADADNSEGQVRAIVALGKIGRTATLPLIEALKNSDANVRRNAAAALGYIKDYRATPTLKWVAEQDAAEGVRATARQILARANVGDAANAVDLYLEQAAEYLADSGVREADRSDVVWSTDGSSLSARDVPAAVYNFELAKKAAHSALTLDPASAAANTMLARAYLGQAAAISESLAANPEDEAMAPLGQQVAALRNTAAATGIGNVRQAAVDSIQSGMVPMAVAAIELLGDIENRNDLGTSPLVAALDSSDPRISYSAALALCSAGAGGNLPAADNVVGKLAKAVAEIAILKVQVVDQSPLTHQAVAEASMKRGTVITASNSALDVLNDLYAFPNVDVVVINQNIADARPEAIVGLIRGDSRMQNIKILIMADDPDAAAESYGERIDGTIQGPVTSDSLKDAVDAALADVAPDMRRARATEVAVAASNALKGLAAGAVDVGGALGSLSDQLTREDAVAVPAAAAIGYGGNAGNISMLLATITGEAASLDLKVACADAAGRIFARSGAISADDFSALLTVATSAADMTLRSAVVRALGKAQIDAAAKLKLIDALRVNPAASDEG